MKCDSSPPRLLSVLCRGAELHRGLFVMATIGVAISGSRLATKLSDISSWFFVVGFGLLIFTADLLRSVEEAAVDLARNAEKPLRLTRVDIFAASKPWRTISIGCAGLLSVGAAVLTVPS